MNSKDDATRLEVRIDRLYELVIGLQERLDSHIGNHHSSWSFWRQNTIAATLGAALVFLTEVLRRFAT